MLAHDRVTLVLSDYIASDSGTENLSDKVTQVCL